MSASTGGPQDERFPIPTRALWTWSTPVQGRAQTVLSYPTVPGMPTKTGLSRVDLENYMGIPISYRGLTTMEVPDSTVISWLRWAEDDIETETNIRLCQTWIASPPAKTLIEKTLLNLTTQGMFQQLGVDYDVADSGYDFIFERWRDEGWGYIHLRWRPVKMVEQVDDSQPLSTNWHGVKNTAFIYPLLSQFFHMPPSWIVEDQNRGLIRFVPAVSVQMLPLFAVQLAFMGFAQSVPQGLWFQYTAGLTPNDYNSEWSFMKELVLARAGITAFSAMQTSINMGGLELTINVDGLMRRVKYSDKGPFAAQIANLEKRLEPLLRRAKMKGGGIHLGIL
jgi:hypothetical protein